MDEFAGVEVEVRCVEGECGGEIGHADPEVSEFVDRRGRFVEALEVPSGPVLVFGVVELEGGGVAVGEGGVVVVVGLQGL